jgi:UDP-N-acetylglucosamine--N-acetylmuramyl-(pentapeptide) pyrophosphoryl-undecaprenol N-acetylglucosamine transferase
MKILFTGGGTGGHFFPLIAVAEAVHEVTDEERLLDIKLYYMNETAYDKKALFENNITFIQVPSGKLRRYFSLKNFMDMIPLAVGCILAVFKMFAIYPDIVFSKGGYAAVPALFAARLLGIPVIIHESDSVPGRVNLWSAKFAARIALCYDEAAKFFPKEKVAVTGLPVRHEMLDKAKEGASEFFGLAKDMPTIFIVGGSLGSENINNIVVDALPELVKSFQIIHQTGRDNYEDVVGRSGIVLADSPLRARYKPMDVLNTLQMKMAAGAATIIVTRAGSTLFEIANWGIPAVVIPIRESVSHDQRTNAFAYAKWGGAQVIEEENLTPSILIEELTRLASNPQLLEKMQKGALSAARPDAARTIAQALVEVVLKHQQ